MIIEMSGFTLTLLFFVFMCLVGVRGVFVFVRLFLSHYVDQDDFKLETLLPQLSGW